MSAHAKMAFAALDAGNGRGALTHADAALAENPEAFDGWIAMARALTDLERLDDAFDAAARCIELRPQDVSGHLLLSRVELKLGLIDDAESRLEKVQELHPNLRATLFRLADVALAQGDMRKLDHRSAALLEHYPDDALSHVWRALFLLRTRRPLEAEAHSRRALEIAPENDVALSLHAAVMRQTNRPQEAIALLQSAVRLDPGAAGYRKQLKQAQDAAKWDRMSGGLSRILLRFGTGPLLFGMFAVHAGLSALLMMVRLDLVAADGRSIFYALLASWVVAIIAIEHTLRAGRDAVEEITLSADY